tara:strand:- start:1197 stop:2075 length:879 start_codon:yes stop_codon:yes gene_type:complete
MSIKILVDPTEEEIIKNIKTRKPFKILGMMDKWKATKKWDLDFFVNNFGNKKIRVKNINENKEMEMTISNYINYINEPYDSNKLLYASDITVSSLSNDLYDEYDVDFLDKFDLFRNIQKYIDTDLNLRWIFIGKKGTYTGLHLDVLNTTGWLGLIRGKKRFYIFNDEDTEKIKEYGCFDKMNCLKMSERQKSIFSSFNPLVVDINPGEIIFTPNLLYHYVVNLENSIAVTENFSYPEIMKDIYSDVSNPSEFKSYIYLRCMNNILFHKIELLIYMVIISLLIRYLSKNFIYN